MQQSYRQEPLVPVRIGLHVGDIIINDNQAFGDGINLASRIESLGVPGSVLISDRVKEEISNHREFTAISMGTYQLKNIHRPVEIFAIDHDELVKPEANSLQGKTNNKKQNHYKPPAFRYPGRARHSIAVLPFMNMSNDSDQDYFCEGVAEEILNSLSALKQLKVAGRASTFRFRGKNTELREIGEKLSVTTVLEGSIRKQLNRVRVTVQLINIEDGFQIWSERYDRNLDDIFAIQDEIALSITEKLKLTLLDTDRKKITKNKPLNTEAYELYLKGRFYTNRRGGAIIPGIKYFQLAIELDTNYALAYVGLADAYLLSASYALGMPSEAGPKAKQAAEKAISLNPALCESYCSLGYYYTFIEWNWEEAEKNFLKSIEINPSYPQAHYWYGLDFLAWVKGDFVKAEKHGKIAIELEPLSAICYGIYAPILHVQKKYKETIAICRKGIELDPYSFTCNLYEGWANIFLGNYDAGIRIFDQLMKLSRHHFAEASLCISYSMMGETEKAQVLLDDMKQRSRTEYVAGTLLAFCAAHMGDLDQAYIFLEKGFETKDPLLLSLKYEHWVPSILRESPRFSEFLSRINFPEKD